MKLFTNTCPGQSVRKTVTWDTVSIYSIAAVVMAILTVFLFGSALQGFDHDENIYCTAGALIASGKVMYKDFAFLHMPLLPVIYASLFTLFRTTNYLFVGRVFSVACSVLTMSLVLIAFLQAFRHQKIYGIVMGTSAAVLYAFNPVIQFAGRFAWNHSLPILCTVVSYLIVAGFDFSKPFNTRRIFLAGLLAGIAVFTRLSFAFAGLAIFLALALLVPVPRAVRFKKLLLPFCAGAAMPSAVAVYYFFKAPRSFIFDTLQYFFITGSQHWAPGWKAAMSLKEKLLVAVSVATLPSYLAGLILFLFSTILAVGIYRYRFWRNTHFVLSFSLAIAMTIAAFVITPVWVQYFAAPVPFILMTVAFAVSGSISAVNRESTKKLILYLSVGLLILSAVMSALYNKDTLEKIRLAFSREEWTPTRVCTIARNVSEIVGPDKIILTLAPIFALEGGERIYQELSTGPFLFRYGRFLSDSQRHIAVSTDPGSLPALLQKKPPDAVLVGFENISLEEPLIHYAEKLGWQKKELGGFMLYIPVNHK